MWSAQEAGKRLAKKVESSWGPRWYGGFTVLIGAFLIFINVLMIRFANFFQPLVLTIGIATSFWGSWMFVTGRTGNTPNNPRWWTIGFNVVALLGIAIGAYISFWWL